jgi:hypothetical protein
MFRNSALQIGVQHMKNLRVKRLARLPALGASMLATGLLAFSAQATQTVDPFTAATGGSNMNGTTVPFTGNAVAFFGIYSTTTAAAESGLGVKVKYDSSKVSVVVSEEYEGCRIAAAQVQNPTTPGVGAQAVMGWIDTSIRTGGAVGWPNVAEPTVSPQAPCLDPGSINGTPTGTTSGQKLFKVVATRVAGFTSGTTPINIDSDGNFSYAAGASSGFAPKSFTIDAAAAGGGGLTLLATNPIVSRKSHGAAGAFDIPISATGVLTGAGTASGVTIEPRQATAANPHRVVFRFASAVASAGTVTATTQSGGTVTATATVSGDDVIVTLGTVTDRSRVQVSLSGATAVAGGAAASPSIVVGYLVGDVDGDRTVTGGDAFFAQQRLNLTASTLSANRFRADLDSDGTILGGDVFAIQQRVNRQLQ